MLTLFMASLYRMLCFPSMLASGQQTTQVLAQNPQVLVAVCRLAAF